MFDGATGASWWKSPQRINWVPAGTLRMYLYITSSAIVVDPFSPVVVAVVVVANINININNQNKQHPPILQHLTCHNYIGP